jgi:hypothetical protein
MPGWPWNQFKLYNMPQYTEEHKIEATTTHKVQNSTTTRCVLELNVKMQMW